MVYTIIVYMFISLFITKQAYADNKINKEENVYSITPLPSELLSEPITLKMCSGIKIVEWRYLPEEKFTSGPSDKSISYLNKFCKKAIDSFSYFLNSKNINIKIDKNIFYQNFCLMPAKIDKHGLDIRNLNDSDFRFKDRIKSYKNGILYSIFGYTDYESKTVFIMNNVLLNTGSVNKFFVTVFVHEMFHAMAHFYKIYENYPHMRNKDEVLAQEFTHFLNL